MLPAWIVTHDGAFICGDRSSGVTCHCDPTSIFAESRRARGHQRTSAVTRLALNILKGERDRRLGRDAEAELDALNWRKIDFERASMPQAKPRRLGYYAVEIFTLDRRLSRAFHLPIAPNMVVVCEDWIAGADILPELADDHHAQVIWYGLNGKSVAARPGRARDRGLRRPDRRRRRHNCRRLARAPRQSRRMTVARYRGDAAEWRETKAMTWCSRNHAFEVLQDLGRFIVLTRFGAAAHGPGGRTRRFGAREAAMDAADALAGMGRSKQTP